MKHLKILFHVVDKIYKRFDRHKITASGAQLAYFLLLSIFPFLMFLIAILGYLNIPVDDVLRFLSLIAPDEASSVIGKYIAYLLTEKNSNLLAVSVFAAFWTSSNALAVLTTSLNQAYGISETRSFIRQKLLAIPFTMLVTLCIAAALTMPIFSKSVLLWASQYIVISGFQIDLLRYLRWAIAFLTIFNVVAITYYIAPNKRMRFLEIIPGTLFATVVWVITSLLFSLYVQNINGYAVIYGSIGAIIILMLWLFWAAMTVIIGGELNAVLSTRRKNVASGMVMSEKFYKNTTKLW